MKKQSVERAELENYLAALLEVRRFRDYCPNGVQVEGRDAIATIVTGVTASLALIEAAAEAGADAILVHHGYFWRGEDPRVVGQKQRRLKALLDAGINLFAYHLPLDMHPELGNNAQLGRRLGLVAERRFGEDDLGWIGGLTSEDVRTVGQLALHIRRCLDREPVVIGDLEQPVGDVAWCTGAAQNMLGQAIDAGASVYLSGEISEPTVHLARESGVAYLACGHHATERYGVQALGRHLAAQFGVRHHFIDIANPV